MKRILVSQNERNNGTDYLIVNGEFLNDENEIVFYGRKFSETDNWKEIYKDDFLEVRKKENQLLLKSFYNERDSIDSIIYYMYLIEENEDIDTVLKHLESDSQLINRTFDREHVQHIIEHIENNKSIKKKIIIGLGLAIGIISLIYLLTKKII